MHFMSIKDQKHYLACSELRDTRTKGCKGEENPIYLANVVALQIYYPINTGHPHMKYSAGVHLKLKQ